MLPLALLTVGGCRCAGPLVAVEPARLVVSPEALVWSPTYVGLTATKTLTVTNVGGASAAVELAPGAPFSSSVPRLELTRGASEEVTITFAPTVAGLSSEVLHLGALQVPLEGEGLAIPACAASGPCAASTFDTSSAQCFETVLPDGTACETSCLTGTCGGGLCRGRLIGCDDQDACTLDGCGEDGCSHTPVQCPVPGPCQQAICDPSTGCGVADAPDGTLCGPDDCLATTVDVCIAAQCVARVRPQLGRCANRWLLTTIGGHSGHAMAYDSARRRVVVFGGLTQTGATDETWEWDGASWTRRLPVAAPPAREGHLMAYDSLRGRVVLFGGRRSPALLTDTWEWDGTNWVQLLPAVAPPPHDYRGAMAFDEVRRRVVLFGGIPNDTWEWDGRNWTERHPLVSPPEVDGPAMAYDPVRRRTVLLAGSPLASETWEWDGSNWSQCAPATSPPARAYAAMAWDATAQRVVVFAGSDFRGDPFADTWEWDGVTWRERVTPTAPAARSLHTMAYDQARGELLVFSGYRHTSIAAHTRDTWALRGTSWAERTSSGGPAPRGGAATAYDSTRRRVVLHGGSWTSYFQDTWEWSGHWIEQPVSSPPVNQVADVMAYDAARRLTMLFHGGQTWSWDGLSWLQRSPATTPTSGDAMAYDAARDRLVLLDDAGATWEWDGTTWARVVTAVSPPARSSARLAFDPVRQRVVLFGGRTGQSEFSDTWEWDGSTWLLRTPATSPPPRSFHGMAFDPVRQRLLVFGGISGVPPMSPTPLADTWEWDGANWTQRQPSSSPGASSTGVSMVYDETLKQVVMIDPPDVWVFLP